MLVAFDVFEFISESEKAPNNDVLFFSMYTMLKPMYLTEKGTGSIANKRAARIVEWNKMTCFMAKMSLYRSDLPERLVRKSKIAISKFFIL